MKFFKSRHAAVIVIVAAAAAQACAQVKNTSGAYVWYDGGKPRQVHVDTSLVAEFGGRDDAGAEPVARANGAAPVAGLRWRLSGGGSQLTALS